MTETYNSQLEVPHLGVDTYLRYQLNDNREWIEATLGCRIEDLACISIHDESLTTLLDEDRSQNSVQSVISRISAHRIPIQSLSFYRKLDEDDINSRNTSTMVVKSRWLNPAEFTIPDTIVKFIHFTLHYAYGRDGSVANSKEYVFSSLENHCDVFDYLVSLRREYKSGVSFQPVLTTFHASDSTGRRDIPISSWSMLTSSASALQLRRDMDAHHRNYKWYRKNKINYRRGYLLYGPPGNGKTTCVKVMASEYKMHVYTVNFGSSNVDDTTLNVMYQKAGEDVPAIVLLEDIDRLFGRSPSGNTSITFQHLLNCLDGVDTPSGLVVIATANHPDELDASILKRPGRFHRIFGFPNPSEAEREAYFQTVTGMDNLNAGILSNLTDRFSYAQLGEVWTQASLDRLYLNNDPDAVVEMEDMYRSIASIKESYLDLKDRRLDKAGFGVRGTV